MVLLITMKIFLDVVGCRLNQSEIETFARQFRAAGHEIVERADAADLVVVNTCAVTAQASSDSRQKIRQAQRAGAAEVIATGCWATLEPDKAAALSGVAQVVPNAAKDALVANLLQIPLEAFEQEPIEREVLPGARLRTRAFIKVQDGCDNRCTFCVTTLARGAGRSYAVAHILNDVQRALAGGAQEVVLTGVHLGSWGQDFTPPMHLRDLIRIILRETAVPRLRLSSLEPWDLDEDFFSLWQDARLCRHLHLPLQSGCDATLRRMARKTTRKTFAALVQAARCVVPEIAITTDLIAGFPAETDAEFAQTLEFVKAMQFAGGHVFTYSARPGTAAARMSAQIPLAVRKARSAQLRAQLEADAEVYRARFLNQTLTVLWEAASTLGPRGWTVGGMADNGVRVHALAPANLWNSVTPVRLIAAESGGLWGEVIQNE